MWLLVLFILAECGLAGLLFLFSLLYLPAKPPTPPSTSASVQRTNYMAALGSVARYMGITVINKSYSCTGCGFRNILGLSTFVNFCKTTDFCGRSFVDKQLL